MAEEIGGLRESAAALRKALDVALAANDRPAAVAAAVDAVRAGDVGVDELYRDVLGPLLADTGAEWQRGAERVWEEHFASATVRTIIESLYLDVIAQSDARERLGKNAVLACPPGEQHDLGLRMLADRLQLAGWDVYYLGADTPVQDIADAARTLKADVVALSAATHYNRLLLRQTMESLRAALPGVRVGVGGPAFADVEDAQGDVLAEAEFGLAPASGTAG